MIRYAISKQQVADQMYDHAMIQMSIYSNRLHYFKKCSIILWQLL